MSQPVPENGDTLEHLLQNFGLEGDRLPWPITITMARYSGVYEGGSWLAFNREPWDVPHGPFDDDVTAMNWWYENDKLHVIGKGSNPEDALIDLLHKLKEAKRP